MDAKEAKLQRHILDGVRSGVFWDVVWSAASALSYLEVDEFKKESAVRVLLACKGTVITTGVGKAGLICRKMSATFSSTGTRSTFLCPTDALHGDLGIVGESDVVIVVTNSGSTPELARLYPHLRKVGCHIILITGNDKSDFSAMSDIVLWYRSVEEAGPHGLAPTTSTTIMLVIGDALAMEVMSRRAFSSEDYARYHPGGALGGKAVKITGVMRGEYACAELGSYATDVMLTMAKRRQGISIVRDADARLLGVVTYADIVRSGRNPDEVHIEDVMTRNPVTLGRHATLADAMAAMRKHHINQIPIINEENIVLGVVDVQDIIGLRIDSVAEVG